MRQARRRVQRALAPQHRHLRRRDFRQHPRQVRSLRRLFDRHQLRPRRRDFAPRQQQPRQHHFTGDKPIRMLQLPRQEKALLGVHLGGGQVIPCVIEARQAKMRAAGDGQWRVAGQLQDNAIRFRRLRQLIVPLLHVGDAERRHQVHDEVTDGLGGGGRSGVGLACVAAIALQLIRVAERPGRRRAHRQIVQAQIAQRALRLRDDRRRLVLGYGDGGADRGDAADQIARLGVGGVGGQHSFGGLEHGFDARQLPDKEQRRRIGDPQVGMGIEFVGGERCEPVEHRLHGAAKVERHAAAFHQIRGAVDVRGGDGVLEGFEQQAVGLIPLAGAAMQCGDRQGFATFGQALGQPLAQQVAEEVVIAIPTALTVQRYEKEVGAFKESQHFQAVRRILAHDRLTERTTHPLQDRRAQQEGLHRWRLLIQHLLDQVIHHKAMAAGEGVDKSVDVAGVSLHRDGGELQPGDPALRARLQRGEGVRAQGQPHRLAQKGGSFFQGEAQIGGAHFGQLAARPQPRQRQRRVLARGNHQVQRRRQVIDQEGQRVADGGGLNDVVVIQHQNEGRRQRGDLVDQCGQDRF